MNQCNSCLGLLFKFTISHPFCLYFLHNFVNFSDISTMFMTRVASKISVSLCSLPLYCILSANTKKRNTKSKAYSKQMSIVICIMSDINNF